jgi:predicted nuclease of restriction endonuclease-like (RecB) superfamily
MNYFKNIEELIVENEARKRATVLKDNTNTLLTYWNIGKLIVEAQGGEKRAKYGNNLIKEWGEKLSEKYGKNYGKSNLNKMRKFYITFPIVDALRPQLTWTHYRTLLIIKNENERNYYINLVILNNLSSRELEKEIKNKAFDRLSYADKEHIEVINDTNNTSLSIKDMIKDPIILKTDKNLDIIDELTIHKYIISLLEDKFLELGTGFALIGHEYKIHIDKKTYKIDLLFFNYKLNSFVVVEVKTRKIKHTDIGQLNFYVNYVEGNIKDINHNKTIGLLIVKEKDKYIVKYTTSNDILVTTYALN